MTITAPAPTATVVQPSTDPTIPALLKDEGGFFRLVNGRRMPTNEPGIAVLDGTPAESALATMESLHKSITALQAQYAEHEAIVKTTMGDHSVATLHGQRVVTWRWGQRKDIDRALAEAIVTAEQYAMISIPTPQRPFEPKFKRSR